MPAINFAKRFVASIIDGTKRQTIRKPRMTPIRPGDMLSLYTGMRTKDCRLIKTVKCLSVHEIIICQGYIVNQGHDETLLLAKEDGFQTVQEFFDFFRSKYDLPAAMVIIRW